MDWNPSPSKLLPGIDDCHCDKSHSSQPTDYCLKDIYVGKKHVAWGEYCVKSWTSLRQSRKA